MRIYFLEWNANYEKLMIKNLESHGVKEIKNVMKHFTKNNIRLKKFGINNSFFVKLHILIKLRNIKKDDLLICNGYSILGFLDIIKMITCKKALVIRDTMIHLEQGMKERKRWLSPDDDFISNVKPFFDKIYSFDPSDCEKYGLSYLKQFLPFTYSNIEEILDNAIPHSLMKKKCFFIGEYREDRVNALREIAPYLEILGYKNDFYLFDKKKSENYPSFCKNQFLDYSKNIQKVIESDVIIEINHQGQDGLTLRAIEALAFNKKIITNNRHLIHYDFYTTDRFFILGHNDSRRLPDFLEKEVSPLGYDCLKEYTADGMLNTLIYDMQQSHSPIKNESM